MKKRWFAVKTYYLVKASGAIKTDAKPILEKGCLIEERVVLFLANSLDHSIAVAEKEAIKYADFERRNIYGQKLKTKYLGFCESFELFDPPGDKVEIFSAMEVHKSVPKKADLVKWKLGPSYGAKNEEYMVKFKDRDFFNLTSNKNKGLKKKRWFSVKTFFSTRGLGPVKTEAQPALKNGFRLEERVVLFLASSFNEAIKKAEKEAVEYTEFDYKNPYGQKLKIKYLGIYKVFETSDPPGDNIRIFSNNEVHKTVPKKFDILNWKLGFDYGSKNDLYGVQFKDGDFFKAILNKN